jgi:hypothetical protein
MTEKTHMATAQQPHTADPARKRVEDVTSSSVKAHCNFGRRPSCPSDPGDVHLRKRDLISPDKGTRRKSRTVSVPSDLSLSDVAFSMDFEDAVVEFQGWTLALSRENSCA